MVDIVGSLEDSFDAQYRLALRRWRKNYARLHRVEAFKVMWDETLEAIVKEKPLTKRALAAIFVNGGDAWHFDDLWSEISNLKSLDAKRIEGKFKGYVLHAKVIAYDPTSMVECPKCSEDNQLSARERGPDHIRMTCERCMLEIVQMTK